MKLNRKWLLLVALVLSVAMATTGTLAYLTDEDKDVNTMTLGKVEIVQNEQERTDHGLDEFTQDKPLYPAVYAGEAPTASIPWADESKWPNPNEAWKVVEDNANVVDKFVTVTNIGKSDAYVRTIIAYEGDPINGTDIHIVQNSVTSSNAEVAGEFAATEYIENVMLDGVRYDVIVYTYKAPLKPDETTIPSLKQIYMDKGCDNEDVEAYGEKYDVLVLSQAIQVNGFEEMGPAAALNEGFGEVTEENLIKWLAETEIGSPNEKYPDEGKNDTNNPPIFYDGYAILADGTRLEWEDLLAQGYVTVDEENVLVPSISMFNSNNVETLCVDSSVSIVDAEYSGAYSTLKTLIVPEGVDSIHYKSFYKSSVESVSFPANFTLGGKTFQQSSLKTLSLPADITLGTSEFRACEALEAVTIPEGLTTLPDEILRDCYALKTVTIPSTVTSIGYRAFYDCKDLTDVYILSESFTIGGQCFHKNASKTPITIHVVNEEMKAAVEAVSGGNAPITVVVDAN